MDILAFEDNSGIIRDDKEARFWKSAHERSILIEKGFHKEPYVPDIFHWVTSEHSVKPSFSKVRGDLCLVVVTDGDTIAIVLTWLLYELIEHPDVLRKLREETDHVVVEKGGAEKLDNSSWAKLEYYQAGIDEALCLYAHHSSGLRRMTPPEGAPICGRWIPGNTSMIMPS
ncbi:cytochrome P450 [Truncatella angustata]|uniref:Cytochrome P450 n=1 Tax=Truncatella angustata TaxID=152316 RepID=A0A9P8UTA0_9PEZI|nr:cytochrome P450 [Truncatella angustata]KAH6657833.1 cytochrome P450 [Truncatella angustata]